MMLLRRLRRNEGGIMGSDKKMTAKGIEKKIVDLKIELLRNPAKKRSIKREIARLLTMRNEENGKADKTLTKLEDAKK